MKRRNKMSLYGTFVDSTVNLIVDPISGSRIVDVGNYRQVSLKRYPKVKGLPPYDMKKKIRVTSSSPFSLRIRSLIFAIQNDS